MDIPDYPLDLAILASYFVLIGSLTWRIYPQLQLTLQQQPSDKQYSLTNRFLFMGLASASFIATWTFMFAYFVYSYSSWKAYYGVDASFSFNLMSHWLHGVTLFDDAWRTVCTGEWAWAWSIELCTFTVAVWTPIIAIEGSRRRISHIWAYMVFGQVVAISTSSALFFAVCLLHQTQPVLTTTTNINTKTTPSWILIGLLFLVSMGGLITVERTPGLTASDEFLPNLLLMHGLLVLPLIYLAISNNTMTATAATTDEGETSTQQQQQRKQRNMKSYAIIILYTVGAIANMYLIFEQWRRTVDLTTAHPLDIISNLARVFLQHPAQSSISSDVVCVHVISVAWMLVDACTVTVPLHPNFIPLCYPPLYFAIYEFRLSSSISPHHSDTVMNKNK
ncbi:hypothetical protein BCR42DRAFT_411062 [Absidia repens]|uniref:Uncharacterized protein n=1 Tax=Absidia repens TaxID=90262 RepID=A0A1X2IL63_9FUNG|nr:hypothetical protein BCR42DRAFT_411062 [Absidia repens]